MPKSNANDRPRTAGELMATPAITLQASCTIAQAAEAMVVNNVGSIVLVDDDGRYQGIITKTSFLPKQSVFPFVRGTVSELMGIVIGTEGNMGYDAAIEKLKSTECAEVMDNSIPTVKPDADIDEVAGKMGDSDGHHIPVVQDGKPMGVVARHDLLHLFFR